MHKHNYHFGWRFCCVITKCISFLSFTLLYFTTKKTINYTPKQLRKATSDQFTLGSSADIKIKTLCSPVERFCFFLLISFCKRPSGSQREWGSHSRIKSAQCSRLSITIKTPSCPAHQKYVLQPQRDRVGVHFLTASAPLFIQVHIIPSISIFFMLCDVSIHLFSQTCFKSGLRLRVIHSIQSNLFL